MLKCNVFQHVFLTQRKCAASFKAKLESWGPICSPQLEIFLNTALMWKKIASWCFWQKNSISIHCIRCSYILVVLYVKWMVKKGILYECINSYSSHFHATFKGIIHPFSCLSHELSSVWICFRVCCAKSPPTCSTKGSKTSNASSWEIQDQMKLLTHRGSKRKAKNILSLRTLKHIQQTNARDSSSVIRKLQKVTLWTGEHGFMCQNKT